MVTLFFDSILYSAQKLHHAFLHHKVPNTKKNANASWIDIWTANILYMCSIVSDVLNHAMLVIYASVALFNCNLGKHYKLKSSLGGCYSQLSVATIQHFAQWQPNTVHDTTHSSHHISTISTTISALILPWWCTVCTPSSPRPPTWSARTPSSWCCRPPSCGWCASCVRLHTHMYTTGYYSTYKNEAHIDDRVRIHKVCGNNKA